MKRLAIAVVSLLLPCLFAPGHAHAQAYPNRPVRVVIPWPPGGGTDIVARIVLQQLVQTTGRPLVMDNRPGAASAIGAELVARAPADGYTLLIAVAANAINMSLYRKLAYDTLRDFTPIILFAKGANLLSVHPSLPVKTLKETIALAKAKPGKLNFASSGFGSGNQMAGELLKVMAGIDIVHVAYKGNAPALTDAISGYVEMIFTGIPSALPHVQSARLRPIAVGVLNRVAALPQVPTFDESGLPGYEATTWVGLVAPAATPQSIVVWLNTEFGRVIAGAEIKERYQREGVEPVGGGSAQFGAFVRKEIDKYAKVVAKAGLQLK